jgi:hypothetical protein
MAEIKALQDLYINVLHDDLSIVGKLDSDGDIIFEIVGSGFFFFSLNANDPEYMMLVYAAFSDEEQARKHGKTLDDMYKICNKINGRCKVAKLHIRDNDDKDVFATAEMIVAGTDQLPTKEHLSAIMKRTLSMLLNGVKQYKEELASVTKV